MFLLNPFSRRFKTPCNCSRNIGFLWLYVTNVTVSSFMPFFGLLNMISVFECHDDLRVWYQMKAYMWAKMKTKHTWKQNIQAYKNYMFLQTHFTLSPERPFSLNWRFLFLGINFPKKDILGRKWKKWTSPLNSAYWNKSRYKISLKLTILIFVPKLLKKGTAGLKQKTRSFACARVRYLLD